MGRQRSGFQDKEEAILCLMALYGSYYVSSNDDDQVDDLYNELYDALLRTKKEQK